MKKDQLTRYSLGFVASLVLTVASYLFVMHTSASAQVVLFAIALLAIIQLLVQLVCFLHLGDEAKPRWRTWTFIAMTGALLLIVFGSIWIMNNMNYHMISPSETSEHMKHESNKGF